MATESSERGSGFRIAGRELNRRRFLAAMGLGSASLFLPSLRRGAFAQEPPKRLLIVFSHHGTVYDRWAMRRGALPDDQDWEFPFDDPNPSSFSEILAPLHELRSKLLVLDGVSMASALADNGHDHHQNGHAHSLTGAWTVSVASDQVMAGGPSIDQIVSDHIRDPGAFPSLEYSVLKPHYGGAVYRDAAAPLPAESDPMAAFIRLFPGAAPVGGASSLDRLAGEYELFAQSLSGEDRDKLHQHRDLIRDLEQRLGSLSQLSCEAPPEFERVSNGDPEHYRRQGEMFAQLIGTAFSCDLTRVASLQLTQLPPAALGEQIGDIHAEVAHYHRSDPEAHRIMTDYHRYHAEQVRDLALLLDSIPEGNGTVLDNTLLVWTNELADGLHNQHPLPLVVLGGDGWAFRSGRYLHWAADYENPGPWVADEANPIRVGPPHNRFLVSIARAFGLERNSVGMDRVPTPGGGLDATGELDRLT